MKRALIGALAVATASLCLAGFPLVEMLRAELEIQDGLLESAQRELREQEVQLQPGPGFSGSCPTWFAPRPRARTSRSCACETRTCARPRQS